MAAEMAPSREKEELGKGDREMVRTGLQREVHHLLSK